MKKEKTKTINKNLNILYFFVFLLLGYLVYKNISGSVFLKGKDKINIVFYSEQARMFSIDKNNVNYLIYFPSDVGVVVPGGYGYYKVGSLNGLADLERKPEIFRKAFSNAVSTFVDLYFYPTNSLIYYTEEKPKDVFPSIKEIFLTKSNGNWLDRLMVFAYFLKSNRNNYNEITVTSIVDSNKRKYLDENGFYKQNQGIFYRKGYRKVGSNVQIYYKKSYTAASAVGRILEGTGIRVVDLSESDEIPDYCRVVTKEIDVVARDMSSFFKCRLKIGETTVSDIILELGNVEEEWAIK